MASRLLIVMEQCGRQVIGDVDVTNDLIDEDLKGFTTIRNPLQFVIRQTVDEQRRALAMPTFQMLHVFDWSPVAHIRASSWTEAPESIASAYRENLKAMLNEVNAKDNLVHLAGQDDIQKAAQFTRLKG